MTLSIVFIRSWRLGSLECTGCYTCFKRYRGAIHPWSKKTDCARVAVLYIDLCPSSETSGLYFMDILQPPPVEIAALWKEPLILWTMDFINGFYQPLIKTEFCWLKHPVWLYFTQKLQRGICWGSKMGRRWSRNGIGWHSMGPAAALPLAVVLCHMLGCVCVCVSHFRSLLNNKLYVKVKLLLR